ncbi:hypothetical protein QF001_000598 [Paraburkholderia youngii]
MPDLGVCYVGQDRLPARLSEFDVERYFALTDSDVAAVKERFRRGQGAGGRCHVKVYETQERTGGRLAQKLGGSWVSPVKRCHPAKRAASCLR